MAVCASQPVGAGPLIPAGNVALRADIQLLADHGIIQGPVTTWPLAWRAIRSEIDNADVSALPAGVRRALVRVRESAVPERTGGDIRYHAALSAAEEPSRIRSFADTPREAGEIGAGASWSGTRVNVTLQGQLVNSPDDGNEYRYDGSFVEIALGNFSIAASTLDRWWGPGWDGSLVLSNNARPIPALTIDRNGTDAFQSPWLGWIGPWDLSVIFGQLETERAVPDTRFFGLRFNFRPLKSLEIGLSRAAQWCGEGRPCDFDAFADLLAGRDNLGDDGIAAGTEPGNQLAGIDVRWSLPDLPLPVAVYGQFIGEDEAGGLPSRFLAQFGLEAAGLWGNRWSWRWFGEVTDTTCGFYESNDNFNCAYNHGIYRDGYRYRGRSIGHGADNDASLFSTGLLLIDGEESRWDVLARVGDLNRGGMPDARNTVTA
ncbi:MAG TPA: capsule assembly Wzi family protein, partial [Woeseiaceae bacterium]|nr:capsule assembly Wzi family protein [Woeseiaceae bacterium]